MVAPIRKVIDEREEGFTLIELLVVMIIIGILAAIAIPVFLNQRNSGYDAAAKSDAKNGSTAEESYFVNNNGYTATAANLPGYTKSSSTQTVTFTAVTASGTIGDSYKIDALSKSGKHFCFSSLNSGAGVTNNGITACP